ncbi:hypothetical protein BAU15_06575 [Enterococcus sp. JM4C]|uniref:glycosyltransferase n=1 Tax=Candidatus Enterococcus huntleyi TaxID=1857217 RepID=UPI00137954E6|nr:nucleotide disphospho-sugar-binding domain-containing protein [Enterococcus sp. JM4C]KAF1297208.1 hypothetical protein BAU15_06575 [Enterococcus sp. JM4C]
MQSILFAPETINLAETTRMIEVAKEVHQLGVQCFFIAYAKKFAYLIEEAGFTVHYLQPETSEKMAAEMIRFDQLKTIKNPFTKELMEKRVAAEIDFIKAHQIEKVVIGTSISLFMSARICQVPLFYVKPFAYSRPQIQSGELFDIPLLKPLIRKLLLSVRYVPSVFKHIEKKYQQKIFHHSIDIFDGDVNLITTYPELTGITELPENYAYTGFIYAKLGTEIPEKIYQLAAEKRPLIYFSMGSSANRQLILKILPILAQLPYTFICSVAYYVPEYKNKQFADNVHIFDWLPTEEINSLIDLSILHGGEGTIQTACLSGKPFIALGLQMEQRYNVNICAKYGNAYALRSKDIKEKNLAEIIKTMLTNPSYQTRAQEMARQIKEKQMTGAQTAANLIYHWTAK